MARLVAVALLAACSRAAAFDGWEGVRSMLRAYFPLRDMAFSAGDATGRKFTFEKGNINMSSEMFVASSSKFPASLAIVGAVADGHLSFATHAHEVLSWWRPDASDKRSRVTLRHLLSFTSGFYSPDAGGTLPCLTGANASSYTIQECAKEVYENAPFEFEPGSTWAYNSFHLQVAGAMASAASGLSMQALLQKYLIGRLNLTGTSWYGGGNPSLAGSMITNGNDYDRILQAYVSYELLPKVLVDEMERDYLEPPVQVANSSWFLTQLLGHYSMCNYFECLPPKKAAFTPLCEKQNIHVDAGLFGYYPLVDRAHGTYMQVVSMQFPKSAAAFYFPTVLAMALRVLIKHSVDRALGREGLEVLGAEPAGMSQRDIWDATAGILNNVNVTGSHTTPADAWRALGVEQYAEEIAVV